MRLLLDPWVAALGDRDDDLRLRTLLDLRSAMRRTGAWPVPVPLGFLPSEGFQELPRTAVGGLAQLLWMLHSEADAVNPATLPVGCPETPTYWRTALAANLLQAEWRAPIIAVPQALRVAWPVGPSISLDVDGEIHDRRVGTLEFLLRDLGREPAIARDWDPWLYEGAGSVQAPQRHPRRLPRPPQLAGIPLDQWTTTLRTVAAVQFVGTVRHLFFIPPADWDPEGLSAAEWRSKTVFRHAVVRTRKGEKKGPVDRDGRVWDWDAVEEEHWDVQEQRGELWCNVSHTGELLPSAHCPHFSR